MGKVSLSYEKSKLSIDSIITEIKKQDIKIQDISTDDGDLEDVFLRLNAVPPQDLFSLESFLLQERIKVKDVKNRIRLI